MWSNVTNNKNRFQFDSRFSRNAVGSESGRTGAPQREVAVIVRYL